LAGLLSKSDMPKANIKLIKVCQCCLMMMLKRGLKDEQQRKMLVEMLELLVDTMFIEIEHSLYWKLNSSAFR
jgi:hypothetical protein